MTSLAGRGAAARTWSGEPVRRALVVSHAYPPDPASVGQYMHDVAQMLVSRGVAVTVYTADHGYEDPSQAYPRREIRDGVHVVRLPLSSFGKASIPLRLLSGFSLVLQVLFRTLISARFDALLVSTGPPMAPLVGIVLGAVRRRLRVVFWAMDLNPDLAIALRKVRPRALSAQLMDVMNRAILRRAEEVIVLDRFMAERVRRKTECADRMTVLPLWPHVDPDDAVPHTENWFRAKHGMEGKRVVMYSGNHSPAHPLDTLVAAAKSLVDDPRLEFLFIGGGNGKQVVDDLVASGGYPNVKSLPYLPMKDLRWSLSAADVHVVVVGDGVVGLSHPSKLYGAMAVGRPILLIGPDPCHASDIVREQQCGWHIPHGDIKGAVEILRSVAEASTKELEAMGERGKQFIGRGMTSSRLCGAFCDIALGSSKLGEPLQNGDLA